MKRLPCCIAGLVLVIITLCPLAWPQTAKPREGMQPYVPTRLEWLVLELNSTLRIDLLSGYSNFSMDFLCDHSRDTIVIAVRYYPTVNREVMNRTIDSTKKIISGHAESLGWSSWLRVDEQIEMIKPR